MQHDQHEDRHSHAQRDGGRSGRRAAIGLRVGVSGTGALTIQTGGTVNNTLGIIGDNAGSSGTATVDGASST